MQSLSLPQTRLTINCEQKLTRVVTSFVENAGICFGLEPESALDLTLASEEIFNYLSFTGVQGEQLTLTCRQGGYFVDLEFEFHSEEFGLSMFNLTAANSVENENAVLETGLLIASRLVDRFSFFRQDSLSRLILEKEKSYPTTGESHEKQPAPLRNAVIRHPDLEEAKLFVRYVTQNYDPCVVPSSFQTPGKVADMVQYGHYNIAIASDNSGAIGGGIVWTWKNEKLVEFFGPFVFGQPEHSTIPVELADHMISSLARTTAMGLITQSPSPDLPTDYFEPLGSISSVKPGQESCESNSYYRHLREDSGTSVWAHRLIEEFLIQEYRKHVLARLINLVTNEGENKSQDSVIATELDKSISKATLKPIWWGHDALSLLHAHIRALLQEGVFNIFFEMDLGRPWECHFTTSLLESGFEPRLVLPYAGYSDILVFQHIGSAGVL